MNRKKNAGSTQGGHERIRKLVRANAAEGRRFHPRSRHILPKETFSLLNEGPSECGVKGVRRARAGRRACGGRVRGEGRAMSISGRAQTLFPTLEFLISLSLEFP